MSVRTLHSQKGIWVNLTYPISRRGSHRAWKGHEGTRHLQHLVCVLHGEHGRACKGCAGEWEVGRGDPCRKLRGPTGSHIGHRSPSVGKLRTWRRALGRGSGNSTGSYWIPGSWT